SDAEGARLWARYLLEGAGSLIGPQSPVVWAMPEFVQCRSFRIFAEAAVSACLARGSAAENRSLSDTFRQQKHPIATSVWAGEAGGATSGALIGRPLWTRSEER